MSYTFVFMPTNGTMAEWYAAEYYKSLDHNYIKSVAPSATFHSFVHDRSRCKFAKLCEAIDDPMQNAFIYEVAEESEYQALVSDISKLYVPRTQRYWYRQIELRYVFKDIDYDRMSTQAVFGLLSKSESKEKEKIEQKLKLKRLSKLKNEMEKFVHTFNCYPDLTTDAFKKTVAQLSIDLQANLDQIKSEVVAERKEANRNKVSVRQKLARFAVYNSKSKKN